MLDGQMVAKLENDTRMIHVGKILSTERAWIHFPEMMGFFKQNKGINLNDKNIHPRTEKVSYRIKK